MRRRRRRRPDVPDRERARALAASCALEAAAALILAGDYAPALRMLDHAEGALRACSGVPVVTVRPGRPVIRCPLCGNPSRDRALPWQDAQGRRYGCPDCPHPWHHDEEWVDP